MTRTRCDRTPAWAQLQAAYQASGKDFDLRRAFDADPQRFAQFSQAAPLVFADLSKNRIDTTTQTLLFQMAREAGLLAHRDAMFAGEVINTTEQREVWHTLLRAPADAATGSAHEAQALAQVHGTLNAMLAFAESVRGDGAITDIVNIGIGGSDLGPQMAVLALDAFAGSGKRLHFVSNVDGHELACTLAQLKASSTLFLVASKTFTTIETMTNAQSAKRWFATQGGGDIARHFAALTTNVAAAKDFGITTTFGFWDWVGDWLATGHCHWCRRFSRILGRGARHGRALSQCTLGAKFTYPPGPVGRLVP
jgi:glucose-6-phosphate isomerase